MNEIGYHGTRSTYRYNIERDGLDPAKSNYRDDHWLGQGVYFFDDYDKAVWWSTIVSANDESCGGIVFESSIEAPDSKVLNLDDKVQLDFFLTETIKTIDKIRELCVGKMPIFDSDSKMRAVFFDYYKEQNDISVIIGTFQKDFAGYTAHRSPEELDLQKRIINIIGIRYLERQICVSKKECIKSTKLIYNEEEEVM